jgi:hypothetical protein
VPEPTGVVAVIAPAGAGLLGLVSVLAPVIATGNTAVLVASGPAALPAVTLSEVLATSDVPPALPAAAAGHRGRRPRVPGGTVSSPDAFRPGRGNRVCVWHVCDNGAAMSVTCPTPVTSASR